MHFCPIIPPNMMDCALRLKFKNIIPLPLLPIAAGWLLSQIIACFHVYYSNMALAETTTVLMKAGYLTVPNQIVLSTLSSFSPAFCGGLFFSMTVGLGLTLIAWIAGQILPESGSLPRSGMGTIPRKISLWIIGLFALWAAGLCGVNISGFSLFSTLYFLIIPPAVFALTRICPRIRFSRISLMLHAVSLMLLVAGGSMLSADSFVRIRDAALLSNPAGRVLNDFYYHYTLYAARAFKSADQRLLRTCAIDCDNLADADRIEKLLRYRDYLMPDAIICPDLSLVCRDDRMIFMNRGQEFYQADSGEFFKDPKTHLETFALKNDPYRFFRYFTFICLVTLTLLIPYSLFYHLFKFITRLFVSDPSASLAASFLTLTGALAVILAFSASPDIQLQDADRILASGSFKNRVAVLRMLDQNKKAPKDIRIIEQTAKSSNAVDRYWLARILGYDRSPATEPVLMNMLKDEQLNVVCMALRSAGKRGAKWRSSILKILKTSPEWYVQWYAYKALKRTGWKQKKSH